MEGGKDNHSQEWGFTTDWEMSTNDLDKEYSGSTGGSGELLVLSHCSIINRV
jgi:hypothetical protein